jgi:hypothetical protein
MSPSNDGSASLTSMTRAKITTKVNMKRSLLFMEAPSFPGQFLLFILAQRRGKRNCLAGRIVLQ